MVAASTPQSYSAIIEIVGVSGGGMNTVNRMIEAGLHGIELIAVNTDTQTLFMGDADVRFDVSRELIRDLGAGASPSRGRRAMKDRFENIEEALKGANVVLVTAGEGGGTGMEVVPIIAKITCFFGTPTIGVMARSSLFEGRRRVTQTDSDTGALREEVDILVVISNDRLLQMTNHQMAIPDAFRQADQILTQGVSGITDLITTPSLINLDFADVKSTMSQAGSVLIGTGSAWGEDRIRATAEMAISSPLLEASIDGACGALSSIAGGLDLGPFEISAAAQFIEEAAHDEANIIPGTVIDDALGDKVRTTVIAADFDGGYPLHPLRLEIAHNNRQQSSQPRGGSGGVPDGGPSLLTGETPPTGGDGSRLAPPHVTPMPLTRPGSRPLWVDDDDDLGASSFME